MPFACDRVSYPVAKTEYRYQAWSHEEKALQSRYGLQPTDPGITGVGAQHPTRRSAEAKATAKVEKQKELLNALQASSQAK